MSWLFPAVVATLVGSVILSGVYAYLYAASRERFLGFWAASWVVYSARAVCDLATLGRPDALLPVIASQLAVFVSAILLLAGVVEFLRIRISPWWNLVALAGGAWIVLSVLRGVPFFWQTLPTYLFSGLVNLAAGAALLLARSTRGLGAHVTGWAFVLWGIHKIDYPWLRPIEAFAPWGYLLAATLALVVALGILLVYFERVRAELGESESRYRRLAENAPDVLFRRRLVPTPMTEYVSPAIETLTGYATDRFYADPDALALLSHVDDRERFDSCLSGAVDQRRPVESRWVHKDGSVLWMEHRIAAIRDAAGAVAAVEGISRDVTERRQIDLNREVLSASVASMPLGMILWTDGAAGQAEILEWNPGAERIFGWSRDEALGRDVVALLEPEGSDSARFDARDFPRSARASTRHRDGTTLRIDWFHSPILYGETRYVLSLADDVTDEERVAGERRELERALVHVQKMEAIGTLAGGIAHDFNNLLAAILGYSELIASRLPEGSREREHAREVLGAANRARDLVQQILAFSRRRDEERRPIEVVPVVKEAVKLLRSSIPKTTEIASEIRVENPKVLADSTRLHQIVMNLGTNAWQATRDVGGTVTIGLDVVSVPGGAPPHPFDLVAGDYALLTVRDTGHGMSDEVRARIFEPYFTTREVGEGTGLGLAVVHGIVAGLGGGIHVESGPGQGATFRVYLPLDRSGEATGTDEPTSLPGGSERILVVDDEPQVASLVTDLLSELGYEVRSVSRGDEALGILGSDAAVDLVVTDFAMPGMDGLKLARRVSRNLPGLPIVMVSGYGTSIDPRAVRSAGILEVVPKPFDRAALARAVRAALDSRASDRP